MSKPFTRDLDADLRALNDPAKYDDEIGAFAANALEEYIPEVRRLQESERTLSILADQVSRIRELVSLSSVDPGPEQGATLDAIDRILRE